MVTSISCYIIKLGAPRQQCNPMLSCLLRDETVISSLMFYIIKRQRQSYTIFIDEVRLRLRSWKTEVNIWSFKSWWFPADPNLSKEFRLSDFFPLVIIHKDLEEKESTLLRQSILSVLKWKMFPINKIC